MECILKLKLTPQQLEILVSDWKTNYSNMTFEEYFENLLKECEND